MLEQQQQHQDMNKININLTPFGAVAVTDGINTSITNNTSTLCPTVIVGTSTTSNKTKSVYIKDMIFKNDYVAQQSSTNLVNKLHVATSQVYSQSSCVSLTPQSNDLMLQSLSANMTTDSSLANTQLFNNASENSATNINLNDPISTTSQANKTQSNNSSASANSKKINKKKAERNANSDLDEERTSQLVSEILKNIKEKTKQLESMNQNIKSTVTTTTNMSETKSNKSNLNYFSDHSNSLTSNEQEFNNKSSNQIDTNTTNSFNNSPSASTNSNDIFDDIILPSSVSSLGLASATAVTSTSSLSSVGIGQMLNHSQSNEISKFVKTSKKAGKTTTASKQSQQTRKKVNTKKLIDLSQSKKSLNENTISNNQQHQQKTSFGWIRLIDHVSSSVTYITPTNIRLKSIQDIRSYLLSSNTCKCGLPCPLNINKVFSFDLNVQIDEKDLLNTTSTCAHSNNYKPLIAANLNTNHQSNYYDFGSSQSLNVNCPKKEDSLMEIDEHKISIPTVSSNKKVESLFQAQAKSFSYKIKANNLTIHSNYMMPQRNEFDMLNNNNNSTNLNIDSFSQDLSDLSHFINNSSSVSGLHHANESSNDVLLNHSMNK